MSKLEKQLGGARAELADAEAAHATGMAGEADASASSATYTKWRAGNDAAKAEVERLQRWISKLDADFAAETTAAAAAAQGHLEAEAEQAAEKAAVLIRNNLAAMAELARSMMSAMASADQKIAAAQRGRRSDLPPLPTTEMRARRGEKLERRIIAEREFSAWSFVDAKVPLDEERSARVSAGPGNQGRLRSETHTAVVVRRRFCEVRYLPEVRSSLPDPLAETLHIPEARAGGAPGWTPIPYSTNADILRQVDALAAMTAEPDRRRPQIEVMCLGDVGDDVAA
jgi:hypothetical protein